MGMSATQARYLNLISQQSDLEFQGQQINESRTTLSEQTNNLYSQLQNLAVPTPPHTSDFTTIQYSGSLGADNFTIGKVIPSGSTYTVNLNYQKAGNSTYSAGKAEIKDTPAKVYAIPLSASETQSETVTPVLTNGIIGAGNTVEDGTQILHKVSSQSDLEACLAEDSAASVYVQQNGKFLPKDSSALSDADFKAGVYVKMAAQNNETSDEAGNTTTNPNYNAETDHIYKGEGTAEKITPGINFEQISSYYVNDGTGIKHASTSDFDYNATTKVYEFRSDKTYYKGATEGTSGATEFDNPDFVEGVGKSLNGNPLMEAESGLDTYLSGEQKTSAIEALRNGFPEYSNYSDSELLALFYVSFSTEGSLKVPHFTKINEVEGNLPNGSQSKWAEFFDITTTGTYTKTSTYDNCELTFDTSGRITKIAIPVTSDKGEIVYHTVELTATSVTDEQAYNDAYNEYEYSKYEYDQEQTKINAQMSIIQEEDKKLELKLQRLDNERTQITTEIEALEKVINDNIESSYKTFSG